MWTHLTATGARPRYSDIAYRRVKSAFRAHDSVRRGHKSRLPARRPHAKSREIEHRAHPCEHARMETDARCARCAIATRRRRRRRSGWCCRSTRRRRRRPTWTAAAATTPRRTSAPSTRTATASSLSRRRAPARLSHTRERPHARTARVAASSPWSGRASSRQRPHIHTRALARTHARMHARTRALLAHTHTHHTHTRTHTHTHTLRWCRTSCKTTRTAR